MTPSTRILAAAVAALLLLVAAMLAIRNIGQSPAQLTGATVLPAPMALPEFRLVDQNGEAFTPQSFLGRRTLVFFGFTHCPDICPATLQQLAVARRKLAEKGVDESALPEILLISVDPKRDTPEILRQYTAHFGSAAAGASGEIGELQKLTSALGIFFAAEAPAGDDYNVNHSAAVLLINARAEFEAVFSAPLDIDSLVSDLQILTSR